MRATSGFNAPEYKKYVDPVSDHVLQATCKNLLLVRFWCCVTDELAISEKATKITFPTTLSGQGRMSSSTSMKTTYCNRMNTEADVLFKPHTFKDICQNVNIASLPTKCFFRK